ncbi:MAG: hypothetical protein IKV52_00600 [Oscillospiraceae bacterium]|nr:hypothetical protein [Oscillospiraceae bacterium]
MSRKLLRHHIIESIKLLSSDGDIQLSYFPEFVCKGDEIANSLGDWLLLYQEQQSIDNGFAFSPEELAEIIDLDNTFLLFNPEDFSDYAVLNSPKWNDIRKKAKDILLILNEEYSLPERHSI